KTDNQKNISTQNCLVPTADMMFQYTKERHYSDVKTLAFHIVQSFKRGEVTTEQAQAIGVETMKRIFGDKYEYIVATHNDTEHIHNVRPERA
ncbi:MAG: relaxase/mobilization nuclease domain-containing protein, partial [Oscillospiraceae bacterium]|nr:relaxase/mobilization nuclease domain-containing protein [Oscillospiraceae bacterium]